MSDNLHFEKDYRVLSSSDGISVFIFVKNSLSQNTIIDLFNHIYANDLNNIILDLRNIEMISNSIIKYISEEQKILESIGGNLKLVVTKDNPIIPFSIKDEASELNISLNFDDTPLVN